MSDKVLARGEIKLIPVNDGLVLSMSPASCVIKADYDGSSPDLDQAFTEISLLAGDVKIPFEYEFTEKSNIAIGYNVVAVDDYTLKVSLTSVPTDTLSGYIKFKLTTPYDSSVYGLFQYSVMRESTMLDWIMDWESNKTSIGGNYLITPKLFVGKKIITESDLSVLTGVYIGPDQSNGAGIYGYKKGEEIFHINEYGGVIGGWEINNGGIQTSDGTFQLLSEGSIFVKNTKQEVLWGIYKSGESIFAKGNVQFHADGSAMFKGKITSSEGKIGGWVINDNLIHSNYLVLDSSKHYIGISPFDLSTLDDYTDFTHKAYIISHGGVCLHYSSDNSFGLEGYLPKQRVGSIIFTRKIFSLGSSNFIAGWTFDYESLYLGTKSNVLGKYTEDTESITIGTYGIRGNTWYIDVDGSASFGNGLVKLSSFESLISGWTLNGNALSSTNIRLSNETITAGIYMCGSSILTLSDNDIKSKILESSGIFLALVSGGVELHGVKNGKQMFKLASAGISKISGWYFDDEALYIGDKNNKVGEFAGANSITIGTQGIRSCAWRLDANGSGSIANGNIIWDTNGNVTFKSDSAIEWVIPGISDKLTKIDKDGIYTGTISANSITSGTISTANIKNKTGTWYLNQDGSGALASGNVNWDKYGNTVFKGRFEASGVSMENYAKLSSAVFYGEYLFSQHGKDTNGGQSVDFERFGTGDFIPNLQINLKTGEIIANKGILNLGIQEKWIYVNSGDFYDKDGSFYIQIEIPDLDELKTNNIYVYGYEGYGSLPHNATSSGCSYRIKLPIDIKYIGTSLKFKFKIFNASNTNDHYHLGLEAGTFWSFEYLKDEAMSVSMSNNFYAELKAVPKLTVSSDGKYTIAQASWRLMSSGYSIVGNVIQPVYKA